MKPPGHNARAALLAAGLLTLLWVQRAVQWSTPALPKTAALALAPIAVTVALVAVALWRGRWIAAAGAVAAVAPAVLAQFGAGQRHGLVAVVAIVVGFAVAPVARRSAAGAVVLVAVFVAGAFGSWWRATPDRVEGAAPSWSSLAESVGSYVARATGGLGVDNLPAPTSGMLAWWVAVAMLTGAAAVSGRRQDRLGVIAVPVGALAVLVAACIVIERWRGPVNPVAGAWLVAGSIAFVAARAELPRAASGRIATTVGSLVAWSWFAAVAVQVRFVAIDDAQPAAWSRWLDWESATGGRTASSLLPAAALGAAVVAAAWWWLGGRPRDPRGVNVVGYHSITGGLGDRTRELVACLRAARVPIAAYDLPVESARDTEPLPPPDERFASTVVVTPAFEVERAAAAHPDLFRNRRVVAGYWFWELDEVPAGHRGGLELVDDVWAPTRFVRDAYRVATAQPVRHVPLPIAEPVVAPLGREALGLPADACVFVMSFSHLSVMERKNPIDAIEAFGEAFPVDADDAERYRLVVKTLNADRKPDDAQRLREAASGDPRIEIREARVEHDELMALIAAADVFVSLHRSEGLGLQIADAMWLGTPVLATDYSGSRDLLDHGLAELIPWHPVPVRHGDGAYPESSRWAQPDLHAAAMSMRRLARDPERRHRLALAARQRIEVQPDRSSVGRALAKLARCR